MDDVYLVIDYEWTLLSFLVECLNDNILLSSRLGKIISSQSFIC